jgi:2'-5' RNA ligase
MDVSGQKMSIKKYFIAMVLPEPLYSKVEHIKQELFAAYGLKGALRSPAHITLHRPFEWKEEKENLLIDKLSTFKSNEKFDIKIRNFDVFEPRVVFVNIEKNEALIKLHWQLASFCKQEMRLFNEVDDKRGFHPHVTIAFRDLKKPLFHKLKEEFMLRQLEGSFICQEFSILKLEKKWEILKSLPLRS